MEARITDAEMWQDTLYKLAQVWEDKYGTEFSLPNGDR